MVSRIKPGNGGDEDLSKTAAAKEGTGCHCPNSSLMWLGDV
jgi:hypothetical protein